MYVRTIVINQQTNGGDRLQWVMKNIFHVYPIDEQFKQKQKDLTQTSQSTSRSYDKKTHPTTFLVADYSFKQFEIYDFKK